MSFIKNGLTLPYQKVDTNLGVEHIYYAASKKDYVLEDHWYNSCRGELRLVLTDCKDWG